MNMAIEHRAAAHANRTAGGRRVTRFRVCAAATAAFAVFTLVFMGNSDGSLAAENIAELLVALIAAAACAERARREHAARRADGGSPKSTLAWTLVAAGVAAWALGQAAWTAHYLLLGGPPPAVSVAYFTYGGFPLFVALGLLGMVDTPAGRLSRVRGFAEALLIAGGLFLLGWTLVLEPLVRGARGTMLERALYLATPAEDIAVLAAVLFVALRRRSSPPAGLALLALGIACVALSDSVASWVGAENVAFAGVSPLGTGWIAGLLLIGLGALEPEALRRHAWRRSNTTLVWAAPVLPVCLGLIALIVRLQSAHGLHYVAALAGIMALVVAAAMLLLVIVTYENRALTNHLERRVRERTAELHRAERHFRALVEHSTDVIVLVGADLAIHWVSDSVLDVYGYRPVELTRRGLGSVFGEPAAATLGSMLDHAPADSVGESPRAMAHAPAGALAASSRPSPTCASDPAVGAFVLNTRDQTESMGSRTS